MDTNKKMREYISAFADGELPDADLELALAALREADGKQAWGLYHLIGDSLRSEPCEAELSPGFSAQLALRLAAEPTPLRRGAGRQATPADALAAIAPTVASGAKPLGAGKLAGKGAASQEGPGAEPKPAAVKRL